MNMVAGNNKVFDEKAWVTDKRYLSSFINGVQW